MKDAGLAITGCEAIATLPSEIRYIWTCVWVPFFLLSAREHRFIQKPDKLHRCEMPVSLFEIFCARSSFVGRLCPVELSTLTIRHRTNSIGSSILRALYTNIPTPMCRKMLVYQSVVTQSMLGVVNAILVLRSQ